MWSSVILALKEQQSTWDSVVASAVRDAVDTVLTPALRELRADIQATNNSLKELRVELEAKATASKQTRDRVDSVQAAAREDRRTVTDLRNQLERLTEKMTDVEDRSGRNDVRLVGLPEGAGGSDAAGFLRVSLSRWIPSLGAVPSRLAGHIACMTEGRAPIGRVLSSSVYWDDVADRGSWGVLGRLVRWGARRTMSHCYFFLTLVQPQPPGEGALFRFWGGWLRWVSSPSSLVRRWLNCGTGVGRGVSTLLRGRRILSAHCHRRKHILWLRRAVGERRPPFLRPGGRGLMAGMETIPAAWEKMVAGWTWIPVESLFFSFLSPPGMLFLFVRRNCLFTGETNSPLFFFFFFWRRLVKSGLDCSVFLGGAMWAFWEARLALGWIGHGSSIFFVV